MAMAMAMRRTIFQKNCVTRELRVMEHQRAPLLRCIVSLATATASAAAGTAFHALHAGEVLLRIFARAALR
jgi:hypothetical protein